VAFALFAMPLFCLAVLLKFAGIELNNWLEGLGFGRWIVTAGPPAEGFSGGLFERLYAYSGAYILPTLCLVAIQFALYSRFQRASMLDTLNADYVRTARAKGLSERQVRIRHVLRNSMIPIVTLFGLDFGQVVGGGAILTETVYNLNGVGLYAGEAIRSLDLPPLIGVTLFGAFFIVLFNTIVDFAYAVLDPRIRLGEAAPA
jgi:peptide/nickel transport system permease protein